jgi:hypothetical protein
MVVCYAELNNLFQKYGSVSSGWAEEYVESIRQFLFFFLTEELTVYDRFLGHLKVLFRAKFLCSVEWGTTLS